MKVSELRCEMAGLAGSLDPALLSVADAKAALADLTAVRNIANVLIGRLGRRVVKAAEWQRAGFPSEEAWLASITGCSNGAAKDALATAGRLEELEEVAGAANRGELSPEQTSAIADACDKNPAAQQKLVKVARNLPLGKLREECGRTKAAADPDAEARWRRIREARRLRFSRAVDAAAEFFGYGTPEQIAVIKAAAEKRARELFDLARLAGRHEPHEAYLLDALEQICREWLDGLHVGDQPEAEPDTAPDAQSDADAAAPAPSEKPKVRVGRSEYLGLLRIDLEALLRGTAEGEELCEITGVGTIPVSSARRLLGDAVLKLVITRGVDVVHVTHLGRGPTVAQQMALLWQSPGCCVTGCGRTAGIEYDHRVDFAQTRHTVLAELHRVCTHHHDLKTYLGWGFVRDIDGTVHCVAPDDRRHPRNDDFVDPRAGPAPERFERVQLFP